MLLWISFASAPVSVFGGTIYAYPPAFQTLLVTGLDGKLHELDHLARRHRVGPPTCSCSS